jgi:hypothetical protein
MPRDYQCSVSINLFDPNFEDKECKGAPIPSSVPRDGVTLTGVAAQVSCDSIIIQTHENHVVEVKDPHEEMLPPYCTP